MKTHLRMSKKYNGLAICGHNTNTGSGYVPLFVVSPVDFKNNDNTCKHCEKIYLKKRNEQRISKGLKPVATWNE